jgi:endonuclease/exonuclease/phosphatase family metal-dependent hydrolase
MSLLPLATLVVLSFNIRYGTADDGPDSWPLRERAVADYLRRTDADIVGLQEALRFQIDSLVAAVPMYKAYGVGRDDGKEEGEHSAILVRADRFEVRKSGDFWLSDRPEQPGSKTWGNRITRLCSWVQLKDRTSGHNFSVFNAHLDHESQPSRERSVALILARIQSIAPNEPVVFTGDFNAGEANAAPSAMRAGGFRDTFRDLHPNRKLVGTFNGFRHVRDGEKIDYVWVNEGFATESASIDTDLANGRNLSDHYPVRAQLRFR